MVHALVTVILLLCGLVTSYAAGPTERLFDQGRAIPFYNQPRNPDHEKFAEVARRSHLAERMAGLVNHSLLLRADIGVGFESCGRPNAFFSSKRRVVVVCYEFIDLLGNIASGDRELMSMPRDRFARVIDGVVWSVFLHELGHAVIAVNAVPVTGREEDVADQFAMWFALNFVDLSQTPIINPTIWFWSRLAREQDIPSMSEEGRRMLLSDEHSLNEQRVYNVGCWALGFGGEAGARSAQLAGVTRERAQRCPEEYAKMDFGMRSHFLKFFKIRPFSGRW